MWDRNSHRYPQYQLATSDFADVLHEKRQELKKKYEMGYCDPDSPPGTVPDFDSGPFSADTTAFAHLSPEDSAPLAAGSGNLGKGKYHTLPNTETTTARTYDPEEEIDVDELLSSGSSVRGETIYSGYNEADIPGTARKGEN